LGDEESEDEDKVMVGLVLGIIFGMFSMLILVGIAVVIFYRKRKRRQKRHSINRHKMIVNYNGNSVEENDNEDKEMMLTRLPPNNIINPIQKPPRLRTSLTNENSTPILYYEMNNIDNIPNSRESRDNHYERLESLLSPSEVDEVMTETSFETELVHPSAYFRQDRDSIDMEQISINSQGTEV